MHIAVLQNDLRRVRTLLHRKKSNVNQPDNRGATPLMLAALIGSPKMVTYLLEKGASWRLQDDSGFNASDYVDGDYSEKMTARYKGLVRPSAKSIRQQKQIKNHLDDTTALDTQYGTKPRGTLVFQRQGRSLKISKLIAKVSVAGPISQNSTTAYIASGDTIKPLMCAVSGWTAFTSPGVLDGAKYTQVVREIAKLLEFDLPKHCYDTPGGGSLDQNVGRFNAVWSCILFVTRFPC